MTDHLRSICEIAGFSICELMSSGSLPVQASAAPKDSSLQVARLPFFQTSSEAEDSFARAQIVHEDVEVSNVVASRTCTFWSSGLED